MAYVIDNGRDASITALQSPSEHVFHLLKIPRNRCVEIGRRLAIFWRSRQYRVHAVLAVTESEPSREPGRFLNFQSWVNVSKADADRQSARRNVALRPP